MSEYHPSGLYPSYPARPDEPFYRPVPDGPVEHPPLAHPNYGPAPYWAPGPGLGYPPPGLPTRVPPPNPMPSPGTDYVQFFRTGRNRWWKGLVAIVALAVGYLVISLAVSLAAIGIDLATGRITDESLLEGRLIITPALLLAINLSAATLIPLSMLLQWWLYGQPVRWLHSVRGYLRWDLLGRMALIIVPLWLVYIGVSSFAFPALPGGPFTVESAALLTIVLLTTPLQAAGEEYAARGLITRAAGSWSADPRIALLVSTLVSATIFMLAHGSADPWLILYYFGFGVAMSLVVWRTGGLEVAALIHTMNNLLLFGVVIISGQDLSASLDRSAGVAGPIVLIPIAVLALTVALVWWWSRRRSVGHRYEVPPGAGIQPGAVAGPPREPSPARTGSG